MDQITRKENCSFTGGVGGVGGDVNSLLQAELKQRKAEEIARKARCENWMIGKNDPETPIFHGKNYGFM
jgi:hypothetical protein